DRFARLEDLAVDDAVPAWLGLGHEPEPGAWDRREALRARAGACRGPQRDQVGIGQGAPGRGDWIRVVTDDADLAHGVLPGTSSKDLYLEKYSDRKILATVNRG